MITLVKQEPMRFDRGELRPTAAGNPAGCSPARTQARRNPPQRGGFTLIEMLVVVIIIAILAGMVLGLVKLSGQWAAKAKTNAELGKVRAAIEEFYIEYGKYPPVPMYGGRQPFGYEYATPYGITPGNARNIASGSFSWEEAPVFTFGLMSFLVRRYGDPSIDNTVHAENLAAVGVDSAYKLLLGLDQWEKYNLNNDKDQARDIKAIDRWRTFLDSPTIYGVYNKSNSALQNMTTVLFAYTNLLLTVKDGWDQELNYSSSPPYQSYKLWSRGPPGGSTTNEISTGPGY